MDSSLARIHARICGDGNISKYESSEPDRNRRAEVVYTNYDDRNIREFREDLNSKFGVKGSVYQDRIMVRSLRVVKELEDRFGTFGSKSFELPEELFKASKEVKFQWIRAFIRDEGYHDESNDRLRIKLMNRSALGEIKALLADLGICAHITGPNCDDSFYLTVSELSSFSRLLDVVENKRKVK
ncbi:hypothetical protein [Candidatus Nanohalococcus occultus]|uniref:hypothetical protein n=1 Tax=Candidatus Nanohalococcus occultus TaxID=2978047 RepID=UPI00325FBD43